MAGASSAETRLTKTSKMGSERGRSAAHHRKLDQQIPVKEDKDEL